ncbi:hypothetical protein E0S08_09130 [Salmonella enterica subsp. enterica serovar Onderstepoort]|nr:hypothetical protein [Salmonella enterica subsp. enterica serovar Onderstepoort]
MSMFRCLHTVHVQPVCINNAGWSNYENNINTGCYLIAGIKKTSPERLVFKGNFGRHERI